ncbi:GntR family transcriptional regulator [Actinomycetaceae bacterium MB13-C1-2]|nr:GntR family transcriptional regulator [Actinomycetaceae bacterium MB13-C1-2]
MIVVDVSATTPPYEQIRSQIAAQIRSGELPDNHRLPSIRQLAGDLRVAPGTVARAYSELETSGLISSTRMAGSRVIGPPTRQREQALLGRAVEDLVDRAQAVGVSQADVVGLIQSAWSKRDPLSLDSRRAQTQARSGDN